jgi:hypothetical protein
MKLMEPSVSVPTATAQRLAETAAPEPELDLQGERSSSDCNDANSLP